MEVLALASFLRDLSFSPDPLPHTAPCSPRPGEEGGIHRDAESLSLLLSSLVEIAIWGTFYCVRSHGSTREVVRAAVMGTANAVARRAWRPDRAGRARWALRHLLQSRVAHAQLVWRCRLSPFFMQELADLSPRLHLIWRSQRLQGAALGFPLGLGTELGGL